MHQLSYTDFKDFNCLHNFFLRYSREVKTLETDRFSPRQADKKAVTRKKRSYAGRKKREKREGKGKRKGREEERR
jgi:hypothetical protein